MILSFVIVTNISALHLLHQSRIVPSAFSTTPNFVGLYPFRAHSLHKISFPRIYFL